MKAHTALARARRKPWRKQTEAERHLVAAHDPRQTAFHLSTCLQCGAALCTGANYCDAVCRHAYGLTTWGAGRPTEQPLTAQLQLSVAVAQVPGGTVLVRQAVLQTGALIKMVRKGYDHG